MTQIFVEPEPGTAGDGTLHVPRGPLIAAGVLMALVFGIAITARLSGRGAALEPAPQPVEERAIRFVEETGGDLSVYDAETGREVIRLQAGTNGFIFGALRGLTYKRTVAQADLSTPFRLVRGQDGRITLDDPLTGMHIAVNSFGPSQVASFELLFRPASAP
ncbi:MAG: hypothetical protein KA180_17045 [Gemmatimonadales bacterium]|nr:hypothetical protein [Gemmatimonadales bacterium]MBP9200277.1 hypothetical protein [Gemmatimonadales bacterium]